MSVDPRGLLAHVEPDLIKVLNATMQSPQPFIVTYGLRTREAEAEAVASHHSTTMHSRHLPDHKLLAAAVDVSPLDANGHVYFAPGHEAEVYGHIANQIKAAAAFFRIPITWGGDWHSFKDWGHFELPWDRYP